MSGRWSTRRLWILGALVVAAAVPAAVSQASPQRAAKSPAHCGSGDAPERHAGQALRRVPVRRA